MFISRIKVSWAGFEICFMFAFSGLYIYEEAYCFCVYVKWVYIALFLPFYFSQITCPSVLQPGQSSSEFIGELLVVFFNWCKFIVGWYWVFLIEVCYSLTSWYRQFWLVNLQSFIPSIALCSSMNLPVLCCEFVVHWSTSYWDTCKYFSGKSWKNFLFFLVMFFGSRASWDQMKHRMKLVVTLALFLSHKLFGYSLVIFGNSWWWLSMRYFFGLFCTWRRFFSHLLAKDIWCT